MSQRSGRWSVHQPSGTRRAGAARTAFSGMPGAVAIAAAQIPNRRAAGQFARRNGAADASNIPGLDCTVGAAPLACPLVLIGHRKKEIRRRQQ